eukprot:scaffold117447_cov33-Phaeocystis_antarctica.AAC.1
MSRDPFPLSTHLTLPSPPPATTSQLLEARRPRTDRASSSRHGGATEGSSRQNGAPSEGASSDAAPMAPTTVAAAKAAPHTKKQKRVSRELAGLQEQHLQQQGTEVAGTRSWRS